MLKDDVYAEFYDVDEPVIKFLEGINEVQHVQRQLSEVAEEQAKDKGCSEVITWVEKGHMPDKSEASSSSSFGIWSYSIQDERQSIDAHQVCK